MKKVIMAALLAAMAVSSMPARAEVLEEEATSELAAAHDDKNFVLQAAQSNLVSMRAARIAVLKARNAKVEALALQDIAEHVNVTEGIEELAKKLGVDMPTTIDPRIDVLLRYLASLQGNRFDRAYLHVVIEAHRFDVEILSQAALSEDADVKAFAEKNLPILRRHMLTAQVILRTLPVE
jgi:putative membrane protein